MKRPLIVVVHSDPERLDRVEHELQRRWGSDFRIRGERTCADGVRLLGLAHEEQTSVALVMAAANLADGAGADLLDSVRRDHPEARRALLIPWGAWGAGGYRDIAHRILQAMSRGQIDYYLLEPWTSPDELFHLGVARFVQEWSRVRPDREGEVVILADRWSPRAHELRSLLGRSGIPHVFLARGTERAERLVVEYDLSDAQEGDVLVLMPSIGSRRLRNPTNREVAEAFGIQTSLGPDRDFDVVVVGAGPAGLSSAVYAASEGLRTLVVERESIGGQASSSSLIRNYLGFPRGVSGSDLTQQGFQQAWVFGAEFLLFDQVTKLSRRDDGQGLRLTLDHAGEVNARTVVLACGVTYRTVGVDSLEDLVGSGVYYGASVSEAQGVAGCRVCIVGAGNSAGQAALHLRRYAEHVSIVTRSSTLADTMSQYLVSEITGSSNIALVPNAEVVDASGDGRLRSVTVQDRTDGSLAVLPAEGLFIMIGAEPRTEWLRSGINRDVRGFVLTGGDVSPGDDTRSSGGRLPYETSLPGVFAVGDVRSGSVKRVAAAVGEGSVVIQQIHQHLADVSSRIDLTDQTEASM
jgi:thioredoxin reductase (NADPH)